MKKTIKTVQADLFNVLVEGTANDQQMARVFFILFIPFFSVYAMIGKLK